MRKIKRTARFHSIWLKDWYKKYNSLPNKDYDQKPNLKRAKDEIRESLKKMQNNLCAYTEIAIDDGAVAHLEHFDPSLKHTDGFKFTNLYAVFGYTNQKKSKNKQIPKLLVPDKPSYNPEKFLDYNVSTNNFIANNNLSTEIKQQVEKEIEILQINSIQKIRGKRLETIRFSFEYHKFTGENYEPKEFPTALYFLLKKLINN